MRETIFLSERNNKIIWKETICYIKNLPNPKKSFFCAGLVTYQCYYRPGIGAFTLMLADELSEFRTLCSIERIDGEEQREFREFETQVSIDSANSPCRSAARRDFAN